MKTLLLISVLAGTAAANTQLNDCDFSCSPKCMKQAYDLISQGTQIRDRCRSQDGEHPAEFGSVEFYSSDNCTDSFVTIVSSRADCSRFLNSNTIVSAFRINDETCRSVGRTHLFAACETLKGLANPYSVRLFSQPGCTGTTAMAVDNNSDCNAVSAKHEILAIQVSGKCSEIASTDMKRACETYKKKFE